jgi:tetratricopeptide (TPR) repeat protein
MTPPSAQAFELIGILKGYEGDFPAAIETFTQGIAAHPADARLYRHRGHRYMNTRQLEAARADFLQALELLPRFEHHYEYGRNYVLWQLGELVLKQNADEVFPDHATVKAAGKYHASLPFKIHYHLGLTQHLLGDNTSAIASFEQALEHSENVDLLVATSNWLVVLYGYEGLGDKTAALLAQIDFEQEAGVNAYYQELLKLYTGEYSAEQLMETARGDKRGLATNGYGLASWLLNQGRREEAVEVLQEVVEQGDAGAFGTVAAEVRLAQLSQ